MTTNWANQTIWTGDNLPILRGMNSESVDLIYLDPPFNSKTNYAAPIGSEAAGAAFKDTWTLSDVHVIRQARANVEAKVGCKAQKEMRIRSWTMPTSGG
ncbi:MAG: hypothetical protein F4Y08_05010 [Caldilineaceae bacterium SB0662_bin_9]|uniref:Site-specific DNA-methyltransferase n=1 Tax=Caldilineaceae bacterium SB0662_bin_9 TaxID=2605258 RepID=A0A6B1DS31_9CHLR|nr:hypothetical protein [Caldilineaceae bacterium SB0662_bin_9]